MRQTLRVRGLSGLLVGLVLLLAMALGTLPASASSSYPTLTGSISGPSTIGENLTERFTVTATGGPAYGYNGTEVGTLSFSASVTGANTTGANVDPTAGVFVNGSTIISLKANNLTQTLVLTVDVTSGATGANNISTNLTYDVTVVQPYTLTATIQVASALGTQPFDVSVLLDGTPVGTITVPSLTSRSTYALVFNYVNPNLGSGWHTFSINIANEHGLVVFTGGATQYSQAFYVQPTPTNYSWVYVGAVGVFFGAIFIFLTVVFGRRRGRRR
jgi:hypothetical protein